MRIKRKRFEVLKRDGFRCRHCGAGAYATVLEVDHVVPVSEGEDVIGNEIPVVLSQQMEATPSKHGLQRVCEAIEATAVKGLPVSRQAPYFYGVLRRMAERD